MNSSDTLPVQANGRVTGWVGGTNTRGTYDIIWTCLVTIFISTYSILCLNVPARSDTWFTVTGRHIKWMALAILGPEFVLTFAAGQWSRASRSVEFFHASGYTDWEIRQGFFAEMGGFVLNSPDYKPFPINAKHVHWLVVNGHIDYPKITREEISDKSKQDTLAKLIMALQMFYLVIQCIGRAVQNLAITTLELNTLAIVICSLMTSFVWLRKPLGVQVPIDIHTKSAIRDIVADQPWKQTPLDFIDENGPGWSVNVQPFMKMPVIPSERPLQRIPNDRFPTNPYGPQEYLLCFATIIFTAVHIAAWNFSFPSRVEQILWRVASMLLFGITTAFWALETIASWVRLGRWGKIRNRVFKGMKEDIFREPEAEIPKAYKPTVLPQPWEFWSITPLALLYGLGRMYLIAEAFLELRSMESSAYLNVNWSIYIPHI